MANVLSLGPENLERTLSSAGLRPHGSVAVEPRLNALSPELPVTAANRVATEATALLGFVVQRPETHIELVVNTANNSLNSVGELVNEDVFTFPGIPAEVENVFFATTDRPATQTSGTISPPQRHPPAVGQVGLQFAVSHHGHEHLSLFKEIPHHVGPVGEQLPRQVPHFAQGMNGDLLRTGDHQAVGHNVLLVERVERFP